MSLCVLTLKAKYLAIVTLPSIFYLYEALIKFFCPVFEEPEDPTNRSFFSEIISSISDVKISNSGRFMISRDYLSVKVWDLHMETKPIESYPVHEYLR